MNSEKMEQLRRDMLVRREELLTSRSDLDSSWQVLHEPERELEEEAKKTKMSRILEQLAKRDKELIEAIDGALRKMELGNFGLCESCGKQIKSARLEVMPWAKLCVECKDREGSEAIHKVESLYRRPLPPELQGMSAAELCTAIYDELKRDGRVELDELFISCRKGEVVLSGALPSEAKRSILLSILEDTMGLHAIEDYLEIDELLWQRPDRTPGRKTTRQSKLEARLNSEAGEQESYESRQVGTPLTPPDDFVPESEE